MSSLPFTPIVRVPKAKRDRSKEEFTIHTARWGGKSPETHTLATWESLGKTYLYVRLEQFEKFTSEFNDMNEYLYKEKLVLCYMSDKAIEMADGSKSFVPYGDWKLKFKVTQKMIDAVKAHKAKNTDMIKLLARADQKIKDKHIAKMLSEYAGVAGKAEPIPETIQKIVSKDLESFIEDDKELTRLVKECYPLITVVGHAGDWRVNKLEANELVTYINAKN
jgi:hypothetical protein